MFPELPDPTAFAEICPTPLAPAEWLSARALRTASEPAAVIGELRTDLAHSARLYDYFLGGKTNYPADREAAEQVLAAFPAARVAARQNRAFLHRAVRFLAGEAGISQFLDVGTGMFYEIY
jgi:hypothetical protein